MSHSRLWCFLYDFVEKVVGVGCADVCFGCTLFANIPALGYGLNKYLSHLYGDFLVPEDVENQSVVSNGDYCAVCAQFLSASQFYFSFIDTPTISKLSFVFIRYIPSSHRMYFVEQNYISTMICYK